VYPCICTPTARAEPARQQICDGGMWGRLLSAGGPQQRSAQRATRPQAAQPARTPPITHSRMLSAGELRAFEESGYVCVDALSKPGGLSPAELDRAEETWDRLIGLGVTGLSNAGPQRPGSLEKQAQLAADRGFIELMCHPFFESLAKQVLRSEDVRVIELGPHQRPPTQRHSAPEDEEARQLWSNGAHIDFQITSADFDATPRRDLLGVWFWVDDVPAERAAMRILPGSHRPIMQHWDAVLTDEHRKSLPRCHGMRAKPDPANASYPEGFPAPADWIFSESEPMPVAVKRGTAQVFTQS
jgi:hypothetical protein